MSKYQCFTQVQCIKTSALMDLDVVKRAADYDPLDDGFTVSNIEKGKKYFLQEMFLNISNSESSVFSYHYPSASDENKFILHHPTEVRRFNDNQLIIGVVTSQHMSPNVTYS